MPRKRSGRPPGRPPHPGPLTPAEERVLDQLRLGHTNVEIAVRLGISPDAVKYHISNMLSKLGLSSREELARWQGNDGAGGKLRAGLPFLVRALSRPALPGGPISIAGGAAAIGIAAFLLVGLLSGADGGGEGTRTPLQAEEPSPTSVPSGDEPALSYDYTTTGQVERIVGSRLYIAAHQPPSPIEQLRQVTDVEVTAGTRITWNDAPVALADLGVGESVLVYVKEIFPGRDEAVEIRIAESPTSVSVLDVESGELRHVRMKPRVRNARWVVAGESFVAWDELENRVVVATVEGDVIASIPAEVHDLYPGVQTVLPEPAPGGSWLLLEKWFDGTVTRYDLDTGVEGPVDWLPASARDLRFSPDGDAIAFTVSEPDGAALYLVDLATHERRLVFETGGRDEYVSLHGWSPDGEEILVATGMLGEPCLGGAPDPACRVKLSQRFRVLSLTGAIRWESARGFVDGPWLWMTAAWAGAGRILVANDDQVELVELTTRREQAVPWWDWNYGSWSFSPARDRLARCQVSRGDPTQCEIIDVAAGSARYSWDSATPGPAFDWTPDGELLLVSTAGS